MRLNDEELTIRFKADLDDKNESIKIFENEHFFSDVFEKMNPKQFESARHDWLELMVGAGLLFYNDKNDSFYSKEDDIIDDTGGVYED